MGPRLDFLRIYPVHPTKILEYHLLQLAASKGKLQNYVDFLINCLFSQAEQQALSAF